MLPPYWLCSQGDNCKGKHLLKLIKNLKSLFIRQNEGITWTFGVFVIFYVESKKFGKHGNRKFFGPFSTNQNANLTTFKKCHNMIILWQYDLKTQFLCRRNCKNNIFSRFSEIAKTRNSFFLGLVIRKLAGCEVDYFYQTCRPKM